LEKKRPGGIATRCEHPSSMDGCTGLQHELLAMLPRQEYHEVEEREVSTRFGSARCQYNESDR
jgi:hypothetical protein